MLFGLNNRNNTCYINSVLQLLLNIKPLRKYFIEEQENSKDNIIQSYQKIVKFYNKNTTIHQEVFPKSFLENVFKKFYFEQGQQEDAHEFLYCFLDHLHETTKYDVIVQLKDRDVQSKDLIACKDNWKKFCQNNYSVITKLFYGQMKSSITCMCGNESVNHEPFCGITISANVKTIEQGIKDYLTCNVVETKCEKCKKSSLKCNKKQIEISPEILIVQVSRFNNNMTKSEQSIEYLSNIDLTEMCNNDINSNGLKYKLIGNIYHAGRMSFGHYLCSVKTNNSWFIVNDDYIHQDGDIDNDFMKKQIYILMYKKIK